MDASDGRRVRRRSRSDVSDVAAMRLLGIAINGSFLRCRKSIRIAKSAWHMRQCTRRGGKQPEQYLFTDSGHWIMEENPTATIALVRAFLDKKQ
jgi:pimeloyl-ACP methyl ester carboxylesterase